MRSLNRLAAVLWDMDGTLVDTTLLWFASEKALVELFAGTWTREQSVALMGKGLSAVTQALAEQGVTLPPQDIVSWQTTYVLDRLVAPLPWRPGALELLHELQNAGIPTALVTTATSRMATAVTAALPLHEFDVVVTDDDVKQSKPNPEGYLRAARELGVSISQCVVIEDSITGLKAGLASGAATLGIPHQAQLPPGEWTLWASLKGHGLGDLAALTPDG